MMDGIKIEENMIAKKIAQGSTLLATIRREFPSSVAKDLEYELIKMIERGMDYANFKNLIIYSEAMLDDEHAEKFMTLAQAVEYINSLPLDQAEQQIKARLTGQQDTVNISGKLIVTIIQSDV
jgi:hypothetical protein